MILAAPSVRNQPFCGHHIENPTGKHNRKSHENVARQTLTFKRPLLQTWLPAFRKHTCQCKPWTWRRITLRRKFSKCAIRKRNGPELRYNICNIALKFVIWTSLRKTTNISVEKNFYKKQNFLQILQRLSRSFGACLTMFLARSRQIWCVWFSTCRL